MGTGQAPEPRGDILRFRGHQHGPRPPLGLDLLQQLGVLLLRLLALFRQVHDLGDCVTPDANAIPCPKNNDKPDYRLSFRASEHSSVPANRLRIEIKGLANREANYFVPHTALRSMPTAKVQRE